MSGRAEGLQLRGRVWWLRVRVPEDVRSEFGKKEVHKSLRTSDYHEAKQHARFLRLQVDSEWRAIRRRRAPANVSVLPDWQVYDLSVRWFVAEERRREHVALESDEIREAEVELTEIEIWDAVGGSLFQCVDDILASEGIRLPAESPSRLLLARKVHALMIEGQKRLLHRHGAGVTLPLNPEFAHLRASSELKPVSKTTLSELVAIYTADKSPELSPKTRVKQSAQFRSLCELLGPDTPVAEITRQQVREVRDLFSRLPSNASKRLPTLSLRQAADAATASGMLPMNAATANAYLILLSSLLQYAVHEELISSSPASGVRLRETRTRTQDRRLPFADIDLDRIFSAPLYTGCVDDEAGYAQRGKNNPRRGRFWVPLIGLFAGMRLNEICQLSLDDIAVEDGVAVFFVRGDDDDEAKRIKTAAGFRFVPIHPELKKIGFLDYVSRAKSMRASGRLFPELTIGSTGYFSDNFSKWFARFLDKAGVHDRRKVFHSFRHNYRDALREAEFPPEKVRALGGWSGNRTEDGYGSGLRASTLARDLQKLAYPALDLSHLHVRGEDAGASDHCSK